MRTLAPKIIRVGNLRVSKSDSGRTAGFDTEVNANRPRVRDDKAINRKLAAEIHVFRPAIKWQSFVEAKSMRAYRREAQRHVASIGSIYVCQR